MSIPHPCALTDPNQEVYKAADRFDVRDEVIVLLFEHDNAPTVLNKLFQIRIAIFSLLFLAQANYAECLMIRVKFRLVCSNPSWWITGDKLYNHRRIQSCF